MSADAGQPEGVADILPRPHPSVALFSSGRLAYPCVKWRAQGPLEGIAATARSRPEIKITGAGRFGCPLRGKVTEDLRRDRLPLTGRRGPGRPTLMVPSADCGFGSAVSRLTPNSLDGFDPHP